MFIKSYIQKKSHAPKFILWTDFGWQAQLPKVDQSSSELICMFLESGGRKEWEESQIWSYYVSLKVITMCYKQTQASPVLTDALITLY